MKLLLSLFFLIFFYPNLLLILIKGQTEHSEFPLTKISTTLSCDEIIAAHEFKGNCCRLFNFTTTTTKTKTNRNNNGNNDDNDNNGCELKVINGRCRIEGPEWELNYRSSYMHTDCPPDADYIMDNPATSSSGGGSDKGSNDFFFYSNLYCIFGLVLLWFVLF